LCWKIFLPTQTGNSISKSPRVFLLNKCKIIDLTNIMDLDYGVDTA
jgi:hypothetical protein